MRSVLLFFCIGPFIYLFINFRSHRCGVRVTSTTWPTQALADAAVAAAAAGVTLLDMSPAAKNKGCGRPRGRPPNDKSKAVCKVSSPMSKKVGKKGKQQPEPEKLRRTATSTTSLDRFAARHHPPRDLALWSTWRACMLIGCCCLVCAPML